MFELVGGLVALCLACAASAVVLAGFAARRGAKGPTVGLHAAEEGPHLPGTLSPRPSSELLSLKGAPTAVPSALEWPLAPTPPPPPPPTTPLELLYAGLCAAFAAERTAGFAIHSGQDPASFGRLNAAVTAMLSGYSGSGCADWRRYATFNDLHYVRHLVNDNEDFELMVICWKKGQGSRVHNHAGSHCWLTTLQGCMSELQYRPSFTPPAAVAAGAPALPGVIASSSPCPKLEHTLRRDLPTGAVGYINDHIALHAVRCPSDCPSDEGGVTLHLYSPPIRRVRLYEPENNRVVERQPGFNTVRGKRMHMG